MIKYNIKSRDDRLKEYTNQEKLDVYFKKQDRKIQSISGEGLKHYEYEQTKARKTLFCAVLEKLQADAIREHLKFNANNYGVNYHAQRSNRQKDIALSYLSLKNPNYIMLCLLAGVDPECFLKKLNNIIECSTEYAINKKNKTLKKYRNEESKFLRKRKYKVGAKA